MAITLEPYNTITLSGSPEQLVAPSAGHWYIQILNNGPGAIQIAQSQAALGTPASFTLNAQLSFTPFVWGLDGVWVEGSGSISVALIPNTGTGAPTGAGAVTGGGGGGGGGSQTPWLSDIDAAGNSLSNIMAINGITSPGSPQDFIITSALNVTLYPPAGWFVNVWGRLNVTGYANFTGEFVNVTGGLYLSNLPTSSAGLIPGQVWNNGGVLNIV